MSKFDDFCTVCAALNEMGITPILYGSTGLSYRLHTDLHPDDVDILIPRAYLTTRWSQLIAAMEGLQLTLTDEYEHTFEGDGKKIAFADYEGLHAYAGFCCSDVPLCRWDGLRFRVLTPEQYLLVYRKSSLDGYRANKKNGADEEKIRMILHCLGRSF